MKRHPSQLVIGSRGSRLALWQAEWVKAELGRRFPHIDAEIIVIKTTGDKNLTTPLAAIGDKGLFTKEIEHALIEKEIDLAVHSLKDIPTNLPEGLMLGAITQREDVRDVFIANRSKKIASIKEIPQGGTVATGSLRRRSQLLNWRPDLVIAGLRGNLDTRFTRLDESAWDGMILARAGVLRLGFEERITEIIGLDRMLPAVGQGALGIEIREGDEETGNIVTQLASRATTFAASGERAFLRFLEGGCQIPIGTHGRIENNLFVLDALIGSLDGTRVVRGTIRGAPEDSETLGEQLARTLYKSGGKEILEAIRATAPAKEMADEI